MNFKRVVALGLVLIMLACVILVGVVSINAAPPPEEKILVCTRDCELCKPNECTFNTDCTSSNSVNKLKVFKKYKKMYVKSNTVSKSTYSNSSDDKTCLMSGTCVKVIAKYTDKNTNEVFYQLKDGSFLSSDYLTSKKPKVEKKSNKSDSFNKKSNRFSNTKCNRQCENYKKKK